MPLITLNPFSSLILSLAAPVRQHGAQKTIMFFTVHLQMPNHSVCYSQYPTSAFPSMSNP